MLIFPSLPVHYTYIHRYTFVGRESSAGIATHLQAGRSGSRIPVRVRFSAPVQTGPGAYPASCIMGTGSFLGVLPFTPVSPKWSLSFRFPQHCHRVLTQLQLTNISIYLSKPCIRLSSPPYVLHTPPISFSKLSPEQYWVRSTDH